jgi:hypothetical protein
MVMVTMEEDDQTTYDKFAEEVLTNGNLDTSDRMSFYELHDKVPKKQNRLMYTLVNNLIERQRKNYRYIIEKNEEIKMFEVLESKRALKGLNRYEYNYLAYLITKHGFQVDIKTPFLPSITTMSLELFKGTFAFNKKRNDLYVTLIEACKSMLLEYQIDKFELLVGGSYIDLEKENPGDIDLIILLPRNTFLADIKYTSLNKIINQYKIGDKVTIDLLELPMDYDYNVYMSYEQITLIANIPTPRLIEEDDIAKEVNFKARQLFKIAYPSI